MKTKISVFAGLALVGVIAVSGCGSSNNDASAPPKTTQSQTTGTSSSTPVSPPMSSGMPDMVPISIKDFAYKGPASVMPGQMILVTNNDTEAHTLTSDTAGQFNVKVDADGGTAMFNAPTKPGSYPYHCDYHSNMHGTLVVK